MKREPHRPAIPGPFLTGSTASRSTSAKTGGKRPGTQFANVGLAERVEFVVVKKHPVDTEHGIHESHMECMRRGMRADARTMIIFEDDIVFDRFSVKVLGDCIRFLSTTASWKIFFFGCLSSGSQRTAYHSVLEVRYRSLTHAYAVRRDFAETLLALPWRNIPTTALLGTLARDSYAAYPSFAFQSNARTDNLRKRKVDRFRRVCGGLPRIQKMNEWYHRNRWAVIGVHLLLNFASAAACRAVLTDDEDIARELALLIADGPDHARVSSAWACTGWMSIPISSAPFRRRTPSCPTLPTFF